MDREAEARAIVEAAARDRRRPPRWLWIVSLVLGTVCVGALAIAWIADRDTIPDKSLVARPSEHSSGLGFGVVAGIGIGIAIGTMIALRRRD